METIPIKTYIIYSLLVYFIIGFNCYIVDRVYGVKFQRKRFNLFHKDELAPEEEFGFLYNRKLAVKFAWAALISTLTNIIMVVFMGTNPVVEVFSSILDAILVFAGILFGPVAFMIKRGRDKAIDKIDEIHESVKTGELQEELMFGAKEAFQDVEEARNVMTDKVIGAANSLVKKVTGKSRFGKETEPQIQQEKEPVVENTEEDDMEILKKFTNRK